MLANWISKLQKGIWPLIMSFLIRSNWHRWTFIMTGCPCPSCCSATSLRLCGTYSRLAEYIQRDEGAGLLTPQTNKFDDRKRGLSTRLSSLWIALIWRDLSVVLPACGNMRCFLLKATFFNAVRTLCHWMVQWIYSNQFLLFTLHSPPSPAEGKNVSHSNLMHG